MKQKPVLLDRLAPVDAVISYLQNVTANRVILKICDVKSFLK